MSSRRSKNATPNERDWKDIVESYPSVEYLAELHTALRKVDGTDLESKTLLTTGRWPRLGTNMSKLKPFLDDWFTPKAHWYGHEITTAIGNLCEAKKEALLELGKVDRGCEFMQSKELQAIHDQYEQQLDDILSH